MSRPMKQGLDYFFLDVELDERVELIEAKHGIVGFGVLIKLFQKIYKEGYYINWSEESSLLFCKRINVDINEVNSIINDIIAYNIFDNSMYNSYKILTSRGIQRRYLSAINKRKGIEMLKKYVIVDINSINSDINLINDVKSTQIREDKIREEKEEKKLPPKSADKEKTDYPDFIDRVLHVFSEEYGGYRILNRGKERKAIGKILTHYKKEFPETNSEEALHNLRLFFHQCVNINDPWLYNNMSPSIIASKFNEIVKVLTNEKTKLRGATDEEIFRAVAKHFAVDFKMYSGEHEQN